MAVHYYCNSTQLCGSCSVGRVAVTRPSTSQACCIHNRQQTVQCEYAMSTGSSHCGNCHLFLLCDSLRHGQAAVHTCVAGVCLSPLGSIMWCMFSCSAKDVRSPPDRVCYCLVYSRSSCMQAALPSCRFFIVIAMICSAYKTRCLEIGLMDVRPVGAKSR